MYAMIECRCGHVTELNVKTRTQAEVLANAHEAKDVRHPYKHDTTITLKAA